MKPGTNWMEEMLCGDYRRRLRGIDSRRAEKTVKRRGRQRPLQRPRRNALGGIFLLACIVAMFSVDARAQVTFERLLNSGKEPQNWLTYSGDYAGRRFSPLDQVKTTNVRGLVPKWVYQTGGTGKIETTPLVVDGILYGTAQEDRAFALDARTGRPIWMYQHALPGDIRPCCGRVNRGLAVLQDKVFVGT